MTPQELVLAMPGSKDHAAIFAAPLTAAMEEFDIDTPQRQAAFLAHLAVESGSFKYMREIWGPTPAQAGYDQRADLGNTKPQAIAAAAKRGSTPGRFYAGHGPMQTTGYDNHLACGVALGLDLVNQPELIEQPVHGCRSAGWFWMSRNLNAYADRNAFGSLTRAINGGYNHLDERIVAWLTARKALGIT